MKTLSISVSGHDSSITLLDKEKLVTTFSCERTNRQKHTNKVCRKDIDVIKNFTTSIDQLIIVNAEQAHVKDIINLTRQCGLNTNNIVVDNSNHHLFHAAASFYPLGIADAICIVVDARGSIIFASRYPSIAVSNSSQNSAIFLHEVTSFFEAKNDIKTIYKKLLYKPKPTFAIPGFLSREMDKLKKSFPHDVDITSHLDTGEMYGTITRHIGFTPADAGKTMGLSAYGQPNDLPSILVPGTCLTDNNFFRADKQIDLEINPQLKDPNEEIKTNLAYNAQRALEQMFLDKVSKAINLSSSKNIVFSGGCSLNILGLSKVKKMFSNYNIYAEPIGTDSSQSLGAAFYYYKKINPSAKFEKMPNLYYGPTPHVQRNDVERLVRYYNELNV